MHDRCYFVVVTGTTVGYGDVSPASNEGRVLNFFFIPLTVLYMSTQLNKIASYVGLGLGLGLG